MQNTWDNFWSSGSVGDYLLFCRARQMEDENEQNKKAVPVIRHSDPSAQAAGTWKPPKLG